METQQEQCKMAIESVRWRKRCVTLAGLLAVVALGAVAARAEVLEGESPHEGEMEGEPSFQGHPADVDENWHLVMGEAIECLAGWQQGMYSMAYAIRAAYLWQNGETYEYDALEDPPMCWVRPVQPVPPELVDVPAGIFQMGDPWDEGGDDEVPVHAVMLDAYHIGKYEVTNQEYADVLNWAHGRGYLTDSGGSAYTGGLVWAYGQPIADTGTSSSDSQITYSGGAFGVYSREGHDGVMYSMADHPMVEVSWYGAVCYCNWLSDSQGLQACYNTSTWVRYEPVRNGYRLPTEAEWERAAAWDGSRHWRYGMTSDTIDFTRANYEYINPLGLTDDFYTSPVGWYNGVHPARLSLPVTLTVNATCPVGAYDMSGNVWEWCHDWYDASYYAGGAMTNPLGPSIGTYCVLRGGSCEYNSGLLRSAYRSRVYPTGRGRTHGFRVAVSVTASEGEGEGEAEGEGEDEGEGEAEEGEIPVEGEPVVVPGELVDVLAGTFQMGDPWDEGSDDEVPVHSVYLDAYQIGKYEVTNQEYADALNWAQERGYLEYRGGIIWAYGKIIAETETSYEYSQITYDGGVFGVRSREGYNGVMYSMKDHPTGMVTWFGAVCYCNWLSEQQGLQACYDTSTWLRYEPVRNGYRLPTEAEWERAAAWDGNKHWRYCETSDTIDSTSANYYDEVSGEGYSNPLGLTSFPYTSPVGWYNGVNPARMSTPGTLTINALSPVGAYDMGGNVYEWCHDCYTKDYYSVSPGTNPLGPPEPPGPSTSYLRVLRGDSCDLYDRSPRSANRGYYFSYSAGPMCGFRVAILVASR